MNISSSTGKKSIYPLLAFYLLLVLAVWLLIALLPQPTAVTLPQQTGVVDLSTASFDNTVYRYADNHWEHWPEALLAPADLAAPNAPAPGEMTHDDFRTVQYATHRVQLRLPQGQVYALSMRSADYAMRLFVDGTELGAVGSPGSDADSNTPGVAEVTYYFQPTGEITTILVQSANWVHKEGAFAPNFTVGTAANIDAVNRHTLFITAIVTGALLMAFLYHMGLFVLNRRRVVTLVFALGCLLLAAMGSNLVALFFPQVNWYAAFRLEYIVHFATFAVLALFLQLLFPQLLHRHVARAYYVLAGLYALTTFIFPPKIYSSLLIGFEVISMGMVAYILTRLTMQLKQRKLQNMLAFVGMLLVCLFGINDILYKSGIVFFGPIAGQWFTTPIAMLFFVCCYALVVALEYAESEQREKEARRQIAEIEQRYERLTAEVADNGQAEVKERLAEMGLSEREQEVAWLLLGRKQRDEIAALLGISMGTVHTHCSRIYKKAGCTSVNEFIAQVGPRQQNDG
ncbi:LuxR C-terminal-related transcriptional regulator [Clostridia bacterium OttesenSCG-928-O13]|nr:LuxR C-terminal-related transcriptional regulator [Clostridia bacterium OttesenSCG-928-O13]